MSGVGYRRYSDPDKTTALYPSTLIRSYFSKVGADFFVSPYMFEP